MNLFCVYCLNHFSSKCFPFTIGCQHLFCSDCINYIKTFRCPPSCPIDNTRFDKQPQSCYAEFLEYYKTLCRTHNMQYQLQCKTHEVFLCEICSFSHKECRVIHKNASEIANNIDGTIRNSKKKVQQIVDFASKQGIDYTEDGVVWVYDENTEIYSILDDNRPRLNLETMRNYLKNIQKETKDLLKIIEKRSDPQINQAENSLLYPEIPQNPIDTIPISKSFNSLTSVLAEAFPNLDYSKMSTEEINFLIEEALLRVNEEIDFIWNPLTMMRYFEHAWIIPMTNKIYSGYFENQENRDWLLKGFSFGIPANLSGFVYIHEFSITIENISQKYENYVIEYVNNRKTHLFALDSPVIWKSKVKIWIYVRMEGKDHYMFECPVIDNYVRATNVDGELYDELFPVLLINFQYL